LPVDWRMLRLRMIGMRVSFSGDERASGEVGPDSLLSLAGYFIPKGTSILANHWAIHLDPVRRFFSSLALFGAVADPPSLPRFSSSPHLPSLYTRSPPLSPSLHPPSPPIVPARRRSTLSPRRSSPNASSTRMANSSAPSTRRGGTMPMALAGGQFKLLTLSSPLEPTARRIDRFARARANAELVSLAASAPACTSPTGTSHLYTLCSLPPLTSALRTAPSSSSSLACSGASTSLTPRTPREPTSPSTSTPTAKAFLHTLCTLSARSRRGEIGSLRRSSRRWRRLALTSPSRFQ